MSAIDDLDDFHSHSCALLLMLLLLLVKSSRLHQQQQMAKDKWQQQLQPWLAASIFAKTVFIEQYTLDFDGYCSGWLRPEQLV
jgi:hypothetical protein